MKTVIILLMSFLSAGTWAQNECSLTDRIFYHDSVSQWEEAFNEAFGFVPGPTTFNSTQLHAMNLQYPKTNVRIYLTLEDTVFNTTPGLVLVTYPEDECNMDNPGLVLTASNANGPGRLSTLNHEMEAKMENWRLVMDSDSMSGYDTVYGYNYLWTHLWEACHYGEFDLTINFGLSNLNAQSSEDPPAIHLYLTSTDPLVLDRKYLDFSRPCPKMCGGIVLLTGE